MSWFRVTEKWRHGLGGSNYIEASSPEELSEWLELPYAALDSNAWRGWAIEQVETPPRAWIAERLNDARLTAKNAAAQVVRFEALLALATAANDSDGED